MASQADQVAACYPVLQVPRFAARHGFSTTALGSVGLAAASDPELVMERRAAMASSVGFDLGRAVLAVQVHGATVRALRRDGSGAHSILETDGLISDVPGQALLTFHADCLPVLYFDPAKTVVGSAHAGWRGTLEGIPARMVEVMGQTYGTAAPDLSVLIGPGICRDCYQVSSEVAGRFIERYGRAERYVESDVPGRSKLDLAAMVRLQLEELGVAPANILESDWCTREDPRWFSHRAGREGRFLAAIVAG